MTGKPYSTFRSNPKKPRPFSVIKIGVNCDRKILHHQINGRVDQMMAEGLESEARNLYPLRHLNSLNTVGYRELFEYFDGTITKEKAIELIKRNSRRYARKQLTWFRNDPEMNWYEPTQTNEIITFIEKSINEK
jgi:tRNA dimethylallyltransferase